MSGKELTIRQIGEFCTNTLCKKCPIRKWNEESGLHNGCMESLRLPAVAKIMLNEIKYRKVDEYDDYEVLDDCKVLGNTIDNPELVEVGE